MDVYPIDEPDFNPIGPRWQMPDGTWFGEGPPDPRRTFDREAYEKKVRMRMRIWPRRRVL